MEQFSPLLGLSSRVMENCDGDMLIRSGKPSSGIRRQVVTGPLLMCPRDVQPSEKWRQQVMQNCFSTPHSYFWCPKSIGRHNRIASNNNQKSILKHHRVPHRSHTRSFVFYFSLSLFPPPFHSFSFSRIYQYLSRLAGRSLVFLVEKHRWRRWRGAVQSSELRGFPIYDEKRYDNVQRLILQ